MNILWLSHLVPYPPKGGVLQRSFNLIKEVSKRHNLHVLAFNQKALLSSTESLQFAVKELSRVCKSIEAFPIPSEERKYGRYQLYLKCLFARSSFSSVWLLSKDMEKRIIEAIEEFRIDLVHFDTISLAPFIRATGKCKKVLNHHNVESAMMLRRAANEQNVFKKCYVLLEGYKLRAYERAICREFDLNLTCSRLDSERLLSQIPELKVEEIPNGVDLDYFVPLNGEKENYSMVFAGGMNWYPNRAAMIFFADHIWPLLMKEIPANKMTVIGIEPPEKLVKIAEQNKNFRVTGFVDDVRPYIDKALIYVCPIQDGGGTKLKILDALAMGKAVVADPIACEGIDVEDGVSVMFAKTPQEYLKKIKSLFDSPRLIDKLGNNGRKLIADKYSFSDIGRRLATSYERVFCSSKRAIHLPLATKNLGRESPDVM